MITKDLIKQYCNEKNLTFKELADKAGMNENGLHDKFRRNSITVRDLEKLLSILNKEIVFKNKSTSIVDTYTNVEIPKNISIADLEKLVKSFNAEIITTDKQNDTDNH